jgi:acetoin utilization deacetylase AcuC-like enzyme
MVANPAEMRVYTHPSGLRHDPGAGHPECPARLSAVLDALRRAWPEAEWREAAAADRTQLARVHTRGMLARVLDEPTTFPHRLDEDTVMSADSAEAALRACGAGIAAVDAVLAGEVATAFCAVRPPGHHATAAEPMGFCLFNAVAVAAAHALAVHGLARVAILDFDVHHGNGTQAIFADDPRVLYLSSHQSPLYPGTGAASETGAGNIVNAPLSPGSDGAALREAWEQRLFPALERFAPDLVLVSAGFDAHRLDPLADLQLGGADYAWLGARIAALAAGPARGRVVSLLEGGYSLAALAEGSVAYLRGLESPATA